MRRETLLNIIIVVTILIAVVVNIHGRERPATARHIEAELQSVMPEADSFKEKKEPFLYYEAYEKDTLIGYCFYTADVTPEIKGYGGPIEMMVGIDKEGTIEKLKILYHTETPQYASSIVELDFLNQFEGKGPDDGFIVGRDVDAITHATVSTSAVSNVLKISLDRMMPVISGSKEKRMTKPPLINLNSDFYITVLIITFLLIAFYLKKHFLRYIGLLSSIVYFGFMKANFISMSNLGSIFLWRLPSARSNLAWYVFIFSGLILTFLFARFYCTYVCPFGGLQIFLSKIFKINIEITPALEKRLRKIRFFLLWILTMLVLVLNNQNIVNYEPFSTVFLLRGGAVAWSIAAIILVLSLFHHRPFCNYFCAAGQFMDILSDWGGRVFKRR